MEKIYCNSILLLKLQFDFVCGAIYNYYYGLLICGQTIKTQTSVRDLRSKH